MIANENNARSRVHRPKVRPMSTTTVLCSNVVVVLVVPVVLVGGVWMKQPVCTRQTIINQVHVMKSYVGLVPYHQKLHWYPMAGKYFCVHAPVLTPQIGQARFQVIRHWFFRLGGLWHLFTDGSCLCKGFSQCQVVFVGDPSNQVVHLFGWCGHGCGGIHGALHVLSL